MSTGVQFLNRRARLSFDRHAGVRPRKVMSTELRSNFSVVPAAEPQTTVSDFSHQVCVVTADIANVQIKLN